MKYIMPIIGLILVVVFMVVIYNGLTAFNTKHVSNSKVWKQTQVMVNDMLLSPKTAEYPKSSWWPVEERLSLFNRHGLQHFPYPGANRRKQSDVGETGTSRA